MIEQGSEKTGTKQLTPISELGEFGLIKHLTKYANHQNSSTVKGIGDDAAIIKNGDHYTVVSTDMLVEGIHFDLMYTPLKHLGYKSIVVNLSDIYAMNAEPEQVTVSIAISSKFTVEALEELYDGILTACKNHEVDLVGGDTSSSRLGMVISVTAIGKVKEKAITYRNTAQVGDYICVSGDLGAAYLGLQLLEREKRIFMENPQIQPQLTGNDYIIQKQLRPEARKDILEILNSYKIQPTAMIDISDGLSSDLLHICHDSNVGCQVMEENVPIHQASYQMAMEFNLNPISCALSGGEDYELLFTVAPDDIKPLEDLHGIAIIGRITELEKGYLLVGKTGREDTLTAQGWKHI